MGNYVADYLNVKNDNGTIKDLSGNDVVVGNALKLGGKSLDEIKQELTNTINSTPIFDILGDGSCVCYLPLRKDVNDIGGEFNGINYGASFDGKEANFNGSSHISLGTANNVIPTDSVFTIAFFVKINKKISTYDRIIGTEWDNGGFILSRGYDGDNFSFLLGAGTNFNNYVTLNTRTLFDVEKMFTVTWDGTSVKIYLDTNLITSADKSSWSYSDNTVPFQIGADANSNSDTSSADLFIDGSVREFRIFNKALSQAEIEKVYNEGV